MHKCRVYIPHGLQQIFCLMEIQSNMKLILCLITFSHNLRIKLHITVKLKGTHTHDHLCMDVCIYYTYK